MKKNLTELVFILDHSGSMAGLEGDTIGGFNAMLQKQRGEPGEEVISTVLFDDLETVPETITAPLFRNTGIRIYVLLLPFF